LEEMDPAAVNGLEAALGNAYRVAAEVIEVIRGIGARAAA
jgi:hypothetical protein